MTDLPAQRPEAGEPSSLARARAAAQAADAKGGQEIVTLDLRGHTLVTDYFVICTATSRVHLRALREGIEEAMRRARYQTWGREGDEESRWVLLDYGDVIVHLLTEETRAYYRLEKMWAHAERIDAVGR